MPSGAVDIVRAWIDCVQRRDIEGIRAGVAPDYVIVEPIPLTYAGTYRGADGYTDFITKFRAAWGEFEAKEEIFSEVAPGVVLVKIVFRATACATGTPYEGGVVEFIHVKHDLITRSEIFYEDPVGAAAALGVHHVSADA
ncbi:nuclear transport factor 2 family protein [Streptomyces sp. NPDC051219]|uniref:nuclear transport factor 2 family protein n=1 Tax=Streptomyces sp. NPDC051219 TaxID=3155283 RepID=UPI003437B2EA